VRSLVSGIITTPDIFQRLQLISSRWFVEQRSAPLLRRASDATRPSGSPYCRDRRPDNLGAAFIRNSILKETYYTTSCECD